MRKNKTVPNKEVDMTSIADVSVRIQTSSESVPSTPSWFGEVALIIPYLRKQGVLSAINSQVRLARRCGHYEVIDFLAVLFGYAISGERTLEEFYERLLPLEQPFMALFDRQRLPSRSALSRFLASLTWAATEALRTLFLADLLARPLDTERHTGQLVDRAGNEHVVFDIDGTRQAARQRALPQTETLPPAQRRLNQVCAPGYTGRKRGEVVRTRTVVSQAHRYHWLGSFGNSGNGRYREELRRALTAIRGYLEAQHLSPISALVRLDGQYGTGAVIADLADFPFIMRGKDYSVLERPEVQSRLHLPADQQFSRSESGLVRQLYDCPDVAVGPDGQRCRVVVATHPANAHKSRVGLTRVFPGLRTLFQPCAARRVHCLRCGGPLRGLVAPLNRYWPMKTRSKIPTAGVLMRPLDKKRGRLSRHGSGTSVWNWGICLSQRRCARPSLLPPSQRPQESRRLCRAMTSLRSPCPGKRGGSRGRTSPSSPMGRWSVRRARRCAQPSSATKPMAVCASSCLAKIRDCRGCPKRLQCQWHGQATTKPRRISVLLHPLRVGPAPLRLRGIGVAENTGVPVCNSSTST